MLIRLTSVDPIWLDGGLKERQHILVNPAHIRFVQPHQCGCQISLADEQGRLTVAETLADIEAAVRVVGAS